MFVRYLELHARTTSTVLQAAHCQWRSPHNLWIVLLTVSKFVDLLCLLSVRGMIGLRAAGIRGRCNQCYFVHTVNNVHTVHTVHNVRTVYTLHTVRTVHTVHTVRTVHTVHTVRTVHTVYRVFHDFRA